MKYVDLSHPISNDMSTYPTDPDVCIVREKEISSDRSLLHRFTMGTHTGTHLDAPSHIIPRGKTLNDFTLSTFTGIAIKVDENYYDKLDNIDEKYDGIIYDTGWYKHYNNPEIFYGSNRPVIPPYIIEKSIKLSVKFFGCDLPSVDCSGSKDKPVHHALLGQDIIIYESLTNLQQISLLTPFKFYGFPLSFVGLDGSPVRAVGVV